MDLVFVRSLINDPVLVKPRMLGSNYMEVVERQLRGSHEGVCSRHGYILPDSISIHKIMSSRVEAVSLNGDVRYDVAYFASVCNPSIGSVIEGRVINMNRFGVLVHSGVQSPDGTFLPVVETIVTRQAIGGVESEVDLDALEVGQVVRIQIAGKKFELNDDKISVIGRVVNASGGVDAAATGDAEEIQTSMGRFAVSHAMLEDPGSDEPEEGSERGLEDDADEAGFDDPGLEDAGDEDDEEDDDDLGKKNKKKIKQNKKKLAILAGVKVAADGEYDDDGDADDGGEDEEEDEDDEDDEEDDEEDEEDDEDPDADPDADADAEEEDEEEEDVDEEKPYKH